ncbi:MAG: hypothetical protein KAU35_09680 [candidate division Zixibacteria bacterium]|nr:hypothetical protein [candidate division Zixibacteria bacterium]
MLYRKLLLVIMGILLVAFALGCSDDDDTVTGSNGDDTDTTLVPAVPTAMAELNAPVEAMLSSNNTYVGLAAIFIELAKGYSSYFTPPTSAEKSIYPGLAAADSVVYTWTYGGLTMTMIFKETTTHYYWVTIFDGTDGEITYENFKLIEAQETIDGTSGWLKMFDPTEGLVFEWQWNIDAAGKFTMVLTGIDGSATNQVEIVVYPDGSGYVEYTEDGHIFWTVTWNAAGNGGTYAYLDNGVTISGTWTSG